jgi:hypothetical protein
MTGPPTFTLDDLVSSGRRGMELRDRLEKAVEAGDADPEFCLRLVTFCHERRLYGDALWFLGLGLSRVPLADERWVDEKWMDLISRLVVGAALNLKHADPRDGVEKGLVKFIGTCDRLNSVMHENCAQSLIQALSRNLAAAAALVECSSLAEKLAKSDAFFNIVLTFKVFQRDLTAANLIGERLKGLPGMSRWTYRALAKLAALGGDYAATESLLRQGIEKHGENFHILCELASILFCNGKEDEGRACLTRSLAFLKEGYLNNRQEEIRPLGEKLAEAMAEKIADSNEYGAIGSAINYTKRDLMSFMWKEHHRYCTKENTHLTISGYTNTVMFGLIGELLAKCPNLRKVINYGTLCGLREYEFSQNFPDVFFTGYDISDIATLINRKHFWRDNLFFESNLDALFARLAEMPGQTFLVHCRTADVMFPEALKQLYRTCHAHGVDLILSAEYFSFCIPALNYPDFSTEAVDAVHWDGVMMIHNYGKVFPEVGYNIISSEFRPMPLFASASGEGRHSSQSIQLVLAERVAGSSAPAAMASDHA